MKVAKIGTSAGTVLILTYWNVNLLFPAFPAFVPTVLILTYWNVNKSTVPPAHSGAAY